ncbi:hypothetical protein M2165_000453 [Variovorax sp. TBS-050B]|uniref:hypothetical protein n=1 Tax=Variovorax sp. TBS-050B TaxID=2940551 RepID=UPI0024744AEE|nr:hypothetical protein [Variovorax sp. TBS-050B]MDH6590564.1 hypothetical protein [Variovorax sp. TBS-050B]
MYDLLAAFLFSRRRPAAPTERGTAPAARAASRTADAPGDADDRAAIRPCRMAMDDRAPADLRVQTRARR